MNVRGVPVVMYHGVMPGRDDWAWNHLITPLDVFEGQMRALEENGWTTIPLARLHDHVVHGAALPEKPVVLTFDDGYLNNWVYVYPVLKKYGHHAAIWMSTDFVDPRGDVRPTIEDVRAGRATRDELVGRGYLSWEEMRLMVAGGHIEIQSHARTHTWYFSGPEIVDFHRPPGIDGYEMPPWLAWNIFPERKHESMSENPEREIPYGTPIYRHGKALVTQRYFEDAGVTDRLVRHVTDNGGADFFSVDGWRGTLHEIAAACTPRRDRLETQDEYEQRVRGELLESRRAIHDALGTDADFLCWPGGEYNATTLRIAAEVGYRATTTHFLDTERRNVFGQDPREINRIGCVAPWIWRGKTVIWNTEPGFFIANLSAFAGQKKSIWIMRLFKLKYLVSHFLTGIS